PHFTDPGVHQPDAGDVQKAEDPRCRLLGDVPAEAGEHGPTGAPGIDYGRNAAAEAVPVRIDPPRGGAGVEVRMRVDKAGRHPAAGDADGLRRGSRGGVGATGGDPAATPGDVARTVEAARRIDDGAAGEEKVVRHNLWSAAAPARGYPPALRAPAAACGEELA